MTNVLVVEDNEAVGRMLALVLSTAGFDARWVSTAAQAVLAAEDQVPDVVLLDICLPDSDGLELARRLRRGRAARARMIGLSGDAIHPVLATVFDAFLLKPVAFPALLRTVRSA